jgi:Uma2 family endonuclease
MSPRTMPVESAIPRRFKFTRDAYYQMAALGLFWGKRVELIEGEVIEMSPLSPRHVASTDRLYRLLREVVPDGYWVRLQAPLSLGESEPEPDVSIVLGSPDDHEEAHPTTAALVVEVSDTLLPYDRTFKQSLYAKAGIPEYWIVNLKDSQVEVYREPAAVANAPFGYAYRAMQAFTRDESVASQAIAGVVVPVSRILRASHKPLR